MGEFRLGFVGVGVELYERKEISYEDFWWK